MRYVVVVAIVVPEDVDGPPAAEPRCRGRTHLQSGHSGTELNQA